MKLPILGVRQIKLPVSDLAVSARGYADLFDLPRPEGPLGAGSYAPERTAACS